MWPTWPERQLDSSSGENRIAHLLRDVLDDIEPRLLGVLLEHGAAPALHLHPGLALKPSPVYLEQSHVPHLTIISHIEKLHI